MECWFFRLEEVTEQEEEVERGTALSSLYSRLEELHTETEKSRYEYRYRCHPSKFFPRTPEYPNKII